MDQENSGDTGTETKKSFLNIGFVGPLELKYEEIPFYRKRWFMVILILFFMPAIIIIDLTGDIYGLRDNKVYKYEKYSLAKICILLLSIAMIQLILRLILPLIL